MNLKTTRNEYSETNASLDVSQDLKRVSAYSYGWWQFVKTDDAGNVFFNNTTYSNSTSRHQGTTANILDRLNVRVHFQLNYTRANLRDGIEQALQAEIKAIQSNIKRNIKAIKTKGSWRKVNVQRRNAIKNYWYEIKDLRNIKNNYLNKKPIPLKKQSLKEILKAGYTSKYWSCMGMDRDAVKAINSFKKLYFKKPNGKVNYSGLKDFFNNTLKRFEAPTNLNPLIELMDLKQVHLTTLLKYEFTQDTCNMIPSKDSAEYIQLLRWLKRMGINKDNLNELQLDKIHTYLINKLNRKSYIPREPESLPVKPELLRLEGTKDLILIKTDQDLRREGRQQSHCIGSKAYLNQCKQGCQALRFKGHTFFLSPDLKLIEAHGKRNAYTPTEIKDELMGLIQSA